MKRKKAIKYLFETSTKNELNFILGKGNENFILKNNRKIKHNDIDYLEGLIVRMEVKLTNISKFLSSSLYGEDAFVNNISIDSRDVKKGDLFIAIRDNFDGHDFLYESIKNGASAIVCS